MSHRFHFFRAGGVDQVSLRDGSDLLALRELDLKLWVALAMPVLGTDIDPETLTLLDHDNDKRIRVEDILAAIDWAKGVFTDVADLLKRADSVSLARIKDAKVVAAAKRMLHDLKKDDASAISVEDSQAITKAFSETVRNGDGIVTTAATESPDLVRVIEDAIKAVGSLVDRSGKPGIDQAKADELFAEVDKRAAWITAGKDPKLSPLKDVAATGDAVAAYIAVRAKIDDYFTRCRTAAYDARATLALAGQEPALVALSGQLLAPTDEHLAALPLAKIDPSVKLPLGAAINPAWQARMTAFVNHAVTPILGARDALTPADLEAIAAKLDPFDAWRTAKPTTKVDELDAEWIGKLAHPDLRKQLADLVAADAALKDEYDQISAVAKTVRMQRDFGRILRNFVNFSDFYAKQDGIFQAGSLFLDARELHLCVSVLDAGKHSALASASDAFLAYCDITRQGVTKQIVVAVTNGDSESVFVGRNGVFYDRAGADWDATVVKIVSNPISIREAFWSPYKKLVKTIEDGVAKRAAAADAASNAKLTEAGEHVANVDKKAVEAATAATPLTPAVAAAAVPEKPAEPKKIDLGTVAAIGVAIGGIGTLIGALLATLFGLGAWLPLGIMAILLMISGPAMLLAWLKLRRRNLGPILEANGWAVNGRARINVPFGAAMTELAKLPQGAQRSLDDPFADKRTPWRRWVILIVILGLGGAWYLGKLDGYLPDAITSTNVLGDNAPATKKAKAEQAQAQKLLEKAVEDAKKATPPAPEKK